MNTFSWKIGGPAGYGIKATGNIFSKAFLQAGYYAFAYYEYPSLVRGGHNTCNVEIAGHQINSYSEQVDILVILDNLGIEMDLKYVTKNSVVLFDEKLKDKMPENKNYTAIAVPFTQIAKDLGKDIIRNTVALGASLAVIGVDMHILDRTLEETYAKLGSKGIKINKKAVGAGYKYITDNHLKECRNMIKQFTQSTIGKRIKGNMFITANESIGMGAIAGGCQFFAGYPMTPATYVLHYLHEKQRESGMIVHQSEDEISGALNVLGASFALMSLMKVSFPLQGSPQRIVTVGCLAYSAPLNSVTTLSI